MKVGIITFHDTLNFGAALQAWATQEILLGLGVETEIINYSNALRKNKYSLKYLLLKSIKSGNLLDLARILLGSEMIHMRKRKFEKFYNTRLTLSKETFSSPKQLKEKLPRYDYYMVGSDQVWNYKNNGCDNTYLLDFVEDNERKISYASSFGLAVIPDEMKDDYARLLNAIASLSVREESGAQIVQKLTGRKPVVVLDPVFLVENKLWENLAEETTGMKRQYILQYTSKNAFCDDFLRFTNYDLDKSQIVKITPYPRPSDIFKKNVRLLLASGPGQFVGLMKNAGLVLTSSFHGVALSIIHKKEFVAFLSGDGGRDSRIIGLLKMLGLEDRIFDKKMTREQVDEKICYEAVFEKLTNLRKDSYDFLKRALGIQA